MDIIYWHQLQSEISDRLIHDARYFSTILYKTTPLGYIKETLLSLPDDDFGKTMHQLIESSEDWLSCNDPNNQSEVCLIDLSTGLQGINSVMTIGISADTEIQVYKLSRKPIIPSSGYQGVGANSINSNQSVSGISICDCSETSKFAFLGLDSFTNEVLISYIISSYSLIPQNEVSLILGFIDQQYGYKLTTETDLGNLSLIGQIDLWNQYLTPLENRSENLSINSINEVDNIMIFPFMDIIGILKQIIFIFASLKSHEFTYGGCLSSFIEVSSIPFNLSTIFSSESQNQQFCRFTCRLNELSFASITINSRVPTRLYNSNISVTQISRWESFPIVINQQDSIPYYQFDFDTYKLKIRLRYMGIPYPISFDIYSFLVSWIVNPTIYYSLYNTDFYRELNDILWFSDETENINYKITNLVESSDSSISDDAIYSLLIGVKLKCNILEPLIHLLQKY